MSRPSLDAAAGAKQQDRTGEAEQWQASQVRSGICGMMYPVRDSSGMKSK
jgi:hypothetical protein